LSFKSSIGKSISKKTPQKTRIKKILLPELPIALREMTKFRGDSAVHTIRTATKALIQLLLIKRK